MFGAVIGRAGAGDPAGGSLRVITTSPARSGAAEKPLSGAVGLCQRRPLHLRRRNGDPEADAILETLGLPEQAD